MTQFNQLQVGQVYDYAGLCEVLGETKKAGDSKKAQMKEWECHFAWTHPINPKTKKPSKKFEITEIYEVAKVKEDGRGKSENSRKALEENRYVPKKKVAQ